ncbi:methionine synthase reductase isoform X1 [Paramormyrops kingsleyae]|uniref:methionine synthase reductase isoform X1 n=2 Tax=Paramormyrops kingsleyae TaxID=1676925 RepID=UPI003B97098C
MHRLCVISGITGTRRKAAWEARREVKRRNGCRLVSACSAVIYSRAPVMPCEVKTRFLLLYGSQRGQAQSIAEEIRDQAEEHGFIADLYCLSQKERYNLEKEIAPVVFVVSTTGDGEPPDTALKFVKEIKDKTLASDHFKHLRYALLALGDTNYTYFCECGRIIDRRLAELGAKPFYATGFADDSVGLEIVVDPWIKDLWDATRTASSEMSTSGQETAGCLESVPNGDLATREEPSADNSGASLNIHLLSLSNVNGPAHELSQRGPAEEESGTEHTILTRSLPPLSQSALNVPTLPHSFIDAQLLDGSAEENNGPCRKEGVYEVPVTSAVQLTREDAVKTALLVELDVSDLDIHYQPGDSLDVHCPNSEEEVADLLGRLGLAGCGNHAVQLRLQADTKKKGVQIPSHIPESCSLQYLLTWCLEIRSVPKKAFLRSLVDCTADPAERRRLQELCSKQGSAEYNRLVRDPGLCLLDLLYAFPSCSPPLSLLIEHLPKLQPRSYSAACSSLRHPGKLHIVFNVLEFPPCPGRPISRRGVCTGWLSDKVSPILRPHGAAESRSGNPDLSDPLKVPVSLRPSSAFRLPADPSVSLIMVGPGTGVAPFIGFLQHREKQRQQDRGTTFGETWLFFGCRHEDRDFLFREELETFLASGTLTHLKVCFSRDPHEGAEPPPKYVQHNLRLNSQAVCDILLRQKGFFYVCGDAKNMAKDVNDTLIDIIGEELQVDKLEVMKAVAVLREEKRYLQDIWS